MEYIIVVSNNIEQSTSWGGDNRDIITSIVDRLTETLGHKIRTDRHNIIITTDELIDFCDEDGLCIADFIQITEVNKQWN